MPQKVVSGLEEDGAELSVEVLLHASQNALRSALYVPHVRFAEEDAPARVVVHILTKGESMERAQEERQAHPDSEVEVMASAQSAVDSSKRSNGPIVILTPDPVAARARVDARAHGAGGGV
jgi:hypothetical protein